MSLILQGSTSGSITLQEPAVAGTTVLDLPAVSGTVLTTTSPKAGNVIQVVSAAIATYVSSSSATFADTGVTATITPTSATSKILILINHAGCSKEAANTAIMLKLLRGSTQIVYLEDRAALDGGTGSNFIGPMSTNYLDSPATTSATTYKTQYAASNGGTVSIGNYGTTPVTSTITLMEIAA